MKAERRHELQQNSLARFLDNLPVMLRLYADRILLVVVLVLLAIVLVRWRINAAAVRATQVANDLATAKSSVKSLATMRLDGPPSQVAEFRNKLVDDVNLALESVTQSASTDATLQSQALLTRGDLAWALANSPALPGAATQPSLALRSSSEEFLTQAAEAYQQVLKNHPSDVTASTAALFGLAAISENRRNWDDATKFYTQIKDSAADKMYKDLAEARLKLLPDIKEPMLVGVLTNKPPDVGPLVLAPTTQATSQPATAPTTSPASQPSH